MKPGDLVKPLVLFDGGTVGVIIDGPKPADGVFGVQEGELYDVLIRGQVCFMFNFELEVLDETR